MLQRTYGPNKMDYIHGSRYTGIQILRQVALYAIISFRRPVSYAIFRQFLFLFSLLFLLNLYSFPICFCSASFFPLSFSCLSPPSLPSPLFFLFLPVFFLFSFFDFPSHPNPLPLCFHFVSFFSLAFLFFFFFCIFPSSFFLFLFLFLFLLYFIFSSIFLFFLLTSFRFFRFHPLSPLISSLVLTDG